MDLQIDNAHCGVCGISCATGEVCNEGACRVAQIYSVSPAVAMAGDHLRIEGVFGASAAVNFPGAAGVTAVALGRNRLDVVVPTGATAGDLTVTSGTTTTTHSVRFRKTTYTLGLKPFRRWYEQAEYARQTPSLIEARQGAVGVNTGSYYYVLGGARADGTSLASVERALINADGTLGPFAAVSDVSLRTARADAAIVTAGRQVYVIGGTGSSALDSVETATITAGELGPFTTVAGVTLATPRSGHVAEIIGSSVVVLGGGGTTVERATLSATGTLSGFSVVAGLALSRPRLRATSLVLGGNLYVIGGSDSGALNSVETATIDGNGRLGAFRVLPSVMASAREGARAVALGGSLYVVGGTSGTSLVPAVERAAVMSDGTLSGFSTVVSLATPRSSPTTSIIGNHLYVFGGSAVAGPTATIERGSINASGRLSDFSVFPAATFPGSLSLNDQGGAVFSTGNAVCAMTGTKDSTNGVECAPVAPDGSLGPFVVQTVATGTISPRRNLGPIVVAGNFLYVLGGTWNPGTCCDYISDVWRAPLGPSGVTGAFVGAGVSLDANRNYLTPVVIGSSIYALGGNVIAGPTTVVLRSSLSATSVAGEFMHIAEMRVPLTTPAVALLGSVLYTFGGTSGSTSTAGIQTASVGAGDLLGAFASSVATTTAARSQADGVVAGDQLYLFGGASAPSTEVATIDSDGALGAFAAATGGASTASVVQVITVGNYVYALSGRVERAVLLP